MDRFEKLQEDTRLSCTLLPPLSSSIYQSSNSSSSKSSKTSSKFISWKEIRIFVSSTFRDYHFERELLIKNIFPRLRDWCENRQLLLTEVDLRWGVPSQSTSATTLRACLGEINRCKDLNGSPFFINMLGHRYGWIPLLNDIPDDIRSDYNWIDGASVTHMEIVHAAFHHYNPNALFLIRDSSFLNELSSKTLQDFIEINEIPKMSLEFLKSIIREKYSSTNQVIDYIPKYDGVETISSRLEKVKFTNMNYFCESILQFLKDSIEKQYPEHNNQLKQDNLQDYLSSRQEQFIYQNNYFICNRDYELGYLLDYITKKNEIIIIQEEKSHNTYKNDYVNVIDNVIDNETKENHLLSNLSTSTSSSISSSILTSSTTTTTLPYWIYGNSIIDYPILVYSPEHFIGKSSLLSSFFLLCQKLLLQSNPENNISMYLFYHSFQSLESNSFLPNNFAIFLIRLCLELGNEEIHRQVTQLINMHSNPTTIPYHILIKLFREIIINKLFSNDISFPIVLILDEVDFSNDFPYEHDIIFKLFPLPLPSYLRVIFSTSQDVIYKKYVSTIPNLYYLSNILYLRKLNIDSIKNIIVKYFHIYNKRLDETQLTHITTHPSIYNMKWLLFACNILRIFGAFETVNFEILSLPSTIEDLLLKYIQIIHLNNSNNILFLIIFHSTLNLLLTSNSGLQEIELREILKQIIVDYKMKLIPFQFTIEFNNNNNIVETNDKKLSTNEYEFETEYEIQTENNSNLSSYLSYATWSDIFPFLKIFLHTTIPYDPVTLSQPGYKPRYNIISKKIHTTLTNYYNLQFNKKNIEYYTLKLSNYFELLTNDILRKREEYPFLLLSLKSYNRLRQYILSGDFQNLSFIKQKYIAGLLRCQHSLMITNPSSTSSPKYEHMCLSCSMKSTFNKLYLNRNCCYICGKQIFSIYFITGSKCTVNLNPSEAYGYKCRLHHPKYHQMTPTGNNIKFTFDCLVCKQPISNIAPALPVIQCTVCSLDKFRCIHLNE